MKFKVSKKFARILLRWYPGIVALLLILVVVLVVLPSLSEIGELRDQIITEQQKLEESYQKGQSLKRAQASVKGIQGDLLTLEAVLLEPGQELVFIQALESAANQNGVSQKIGMDDLPPNITKTTALPLRVDLSGTFDQLVGYLSTLERQPFYVSWDSLVINTGRSLGGRAQPRLVPASSEEIPVNDLSMTLNGNSYWQVSNKVN